MLKILILDNVILLKEIDSTPDTISNDVNVYLKMTKINVGGVLLDVTKRIMISDIRKQPKYLMIYVR